jgi:predicted amidohydrolase
MELAELGHRIVTIVTLCLLNGQDYENRPYVLQELRKCPEMVDFVVLPHMPFLSFDTDRAARDLRRFSDFARQRQCYLALSMTEHDGDDTYFTAVLFDRKGNMAGRYRKAHALADDVTGPEQPIAIGDDLPVFETDFGIIGMTVGTDFYLPEVYEVIRMKGADIITWHHYPERLRDHCTWEPLLMARCVDSHAHMVTAMYSHERTYLTNDYSQRRAGSPWGRSMILNRVGTPVADTGYEDGLAVATVNLDRRKVDDGVDFRRENIFIVSHFGDRKALSPVAESYQKPELPAYDKRTCRLAIGHLPLEDIWRDGQVPEAMLQLLDDAAAVKPDLLLFSEQSCNAEDETTARVMDMVAEKARELDCYIAIGGIGNYGHSSVCHVWDRSGEIVYAQPIYWTQGFDELEVFDTDFGRVGSHTCGDLFTPLFDRVLALKGAEIVIDPSQMWGPNGHLNERMLRARAADNGVWVACAHWGKSDPALRSVIIDPYGQVVAASQYGKADLVVYDINLDDQRAYYAEVAPPRGDKTVDLSWWPAVVPQRLPGWQEMVFAARRPELYGIIPTVNEVLLRYRPEKSPYAPTEE